MIKGPMKVKVIRDKKIIEDHFRKNTDLNIYSIGDLDDFFWKYTKWLAAFDGERIAQIALLYQASDHSTFLAITDNEIKSMYELIENVYETLPGKLYCHLSKGLVEAFGKNIKRNDHGAHYKMSLKNKEMLLKNDTEKIKRLNPEYISLINKLYGESYPDNFFDKRMLETGKYFGYFENEELTGISGIHVYSEPYKVATLGNITIHPLYRGKSICQKLTSALCRDLLLTVDNIGLNVSINNLSAINCYRKIGFEIIGEYEEYEIIKT